MGKNRTVPPAPLAPWISGSRKHAHEILRKIDSGEKLPARETEILAGTVLALVQRIEEMWNAAAAVVFHLEIATMDEDLTEVLSPNEGVTPPLGGVPASERGVVGGHEIDGWPHYRDGRWTMGCSCGAHFAEKTESAVEYVANEHVRIANG